MGTLQAGTGCPRYPGPLPSPASLPAVGVLLGLEGEATDAEVVRAVLAGDVERYAVLVRRYRDRYARYASRMLGSRDEIGRASWRGRGEISVVAGSLKKK